MTGADVAFGAIVVAASTSHERSKIQSCDAPFIVDTLEQVHVIVDRDDLKFTLAKRW